MKVAQTVADARRAIADLPRPLGLVPTMGALHEGHLALLRAARQSCASVVMSLFVNPTQFGGSEDYTRYPRDEARDLASAEQEGVDLVFAPPAAEMYPQGFATTVRVDGPLRDALEGATRPGHFDGVATVVAKLFTVLAPDTAFFGCKDAQQLALIRRLVRDLDLPVEVVGVPTVREADGLAMSSRNAYLDKPARVVAARLYRALLTGRAAATPDGDAQAVLEAVARELTRVDDGDEGPRLTLDYVAVVDPDTFVAETTLGWRSLIVVAAMLGTTRLIDNLPVWPAANEPAPITPQATHPGGAAEPAPGRKER